MVTTLSMCADLEQPCRQAFHPNLPQIRGVLLSDWLKRTVRGRSLSLICARSWSRCWSSGDVWMPGAPTRGCVYAPLRPVCLPTARSCSWRRLSRCKAVGHVESTEDTLHGLPVTRPRMAKHSRAAISASKTALRGVETVCVTLDNPTFSLSLCMRTV
jgi:hypothetical protein